MKMKLRSEPRLQALPEWQGRIKRLLLTMPQEPFTHQDVYRRFRALFYAMRDSECIFTVVGARPPADLPMRHEERIIVPIKLGAVPTQCRIEYVSFAATDRVKLSAWIQDQMIVRRDAKTGRPNLLVAKSDAEFKTRMGVEDVAALLSREENYDCQEMNNKVTGGEILVGGSQYAFCGDDILPAASGNWARIDNSRRTESTQLLKRQLGVKQIVWVDKLLRSRLITRTGPRDLRLKADIGHIDLFMSLGGPSRGARNKHIIFLAELKPDYCNSKLAFSKFEIFEEQTSLNCIAQEIERLKCGDISFEVVRLPMFIDARGPKVKYKSFNNSLLEVDGSLRRAYVPVYGSQPNLQECSAYRRAEDKMIKTFHAQGFEVRPVTGKFPSDLASDGALRCASKVLERNFLC